MRLKPAKRSPLLTLLICGALLVAFYVLSALAVQTKSITTDEPLHALGGYLRLKYGDFRLNPEDPPLFAYWAMLPHPGHELNINFNSPIWRRIKDNQFVQWIFCIETFFGTAGNHADAFINRSRMVMLLLGVALGATIALWSWRLGGAAAAVTATAVFALDPNFLGHAPLVKNDVALTLVLAVLMYQTWRLGQRVTPWRILAVALLCGAAVNVKFSGLVAGPIVAVVLLSRAMLRIPWPVMRGTVHAIRGKLIVVAIVLGVAVLVSYAAIWACYGFRFAPTPDGKIRLNINLLLRSEAINAWRAVDDHDSFTEPPPKVIQEWRPPPTVRAILWTEHHHLLPHAWLVGLLYTHQSAVMRQSFLLGHFSNHGWWYYFPLAMAFKTPLATLLALLAAFLVLIRCRPAPWMAICLAAPVIIYGGMAMRSNLNLGLRHILPIYPYLFIAIGGAASAALRLWPTRSRAAIGALALGLAVESLAAFPNYIAFFNVAAGGPRGGFHLLGDSNLDWGQDLKLLAQWQQMHPNVELYLNSFGTADPGTYGIRYLNLPGGYLFGPPPVVPRQPGVIAITATQLQTIYMPPELRHAYMSLWNIPPLAVLGGTVYLYRFPQPGLTAANFPDSLLKHAAPQLGAP